jgi:hypothetical protein
LRDPCRRRIVATDGDGLWLIDLDKDAALVLFELLTSREEELVGSLRLGPPERNALRSLEGALERTLVEPFSPEYASLLALARTALVDRGGE